jgi:hypothetical protein
MRRFLSFIGTVIVVLSMVFGYVFYVRGNLAKEDLEVMTGLRDELKEENSSLKEENEKIKKELEAKKKAEVKENTVKKEETKPEEKAEEKTEEKSASKDVNPLDVKAAYVKRLKSYESYGKAVEYAVTDINKDGIYELIVTTGDSEAEKMTYFYSYKSGRIFSLGETGGSHSTYYEMNSGNYIMHLNAHMGSELITHISIKDNKIVEEKISEKEIKPEEEYSSGDRLIVFKDVKDQSLLDVIK